MNDKRSFKRISSKAFLSFRPLEKKTFDRIHMHYMPADALNISTGGIQFQSNTMIPVGTLVKMRLHLFSLLIEKKLCDPEEIEDIPDLVVVAQIIRSEKTTDNEHVFSAEFEYFVEGQVESLKQYIEKYF